eukprot:TRINITY_DN4494_c0_g1_i1.p1 TRINITY_DN4494_c0_g1~~TRINITY_DN4494_c0_g1_i1.p1  ORF type:complete len:2123 (+),score=500.62 TRINITY_DN4494_c0_g1_i1:747-6371(+)
MEDEDSAEQLQTEQQLNFHSIDAHWIQRQVRPYYEGDAMTAQKVAQDLFEVLQLKDRRVVENRLVALVGFDKPALFSMLLKNQWKIVYAIKLKTANENERALILAEIRADPSLAWLLAEIEGKKDARQARRAAESATVTTRDIAMEDARSRNLLNLESLSFSGGHFMANKRVDLPQGSFRTQRKGFEEVHVPAPPAPEAAIGDLVRIEKLPAFAHAAFPKMKTLNRVQSAMYEAAFKQPQNLLLCAPTGAGKTNVAMLTILRQLEQVNHDLSRFKVVYVAPMKALVQEVAHSFQTRLESYGIKVSELTGDQQLNKQQIRDTHIIITTPEKWDVVTRKSGHLQFTSTVGLIIIDEIHLLHDDRGPVLETLVSRTIRLTEQSGYHVRIVGLSATLPNYQDVAMFLRVKIQGPDKGLFFFDSSYRPCPLQQIYIGISEKKAIKRFNLMNTITYEKVMERAGKKQMIVFVHSRKETAKTARTIRDLATAEDKLNLFIKSAEVRGLLQQEAQTVKNADLKELLPYGLGIHHAGLDKAERQMVEDLFFGGHIQVLFSTATLAWGVNLPASTVIIKGTQIYSPEKGRWAELSSMDIMQMLGRAGRPAYDKEGEGIVITSHQELQFYLSLLNQQLPIESQFVSKLADNLNAEIVLGTVNNISEAVSWLGYTYLYIRMQREPSLYGINQDMLDDDPKLVGRRADLVHSAATLLDQANLINYDRRSGNFQVTDLGRVASHYYLTYQSIGVYNEFLKPSMSNIELLRLFALSAEFKFINVREEEKVELQRLVEQVPIPVKESIEEPSAKVNILLQSYISRLRLDGFALASDMVYITQSSGRIMRALFEIVLKRGWAQLANRLRELFLMVDKRMWNVQTPLRQFPPRLIPDEVLRKIEKKDISWERYYDFSAAELGEMVRIPKMGKNLHRAIRQIPKLEVVAHVQPVTRSVLKVELQILPDFDFDETVHGKGEPFWILVEDGDGERILHYEYFFLKQKFREEEHFVDFTVPMFEPLPPQYFVRIVSDRWLRSETVLPLSFKTLLLPEKNVPATELVDLNPMPVSSLPVQFQKLYDFALFNPIQTQVFNALYNSDENVLLCAPTGSGKTACAEFAMMRCWQTNGGRIVYIAPLQAIVTERLNNWTKRFSDKVVVELSGDAIADLKLLESADIILATPEKWDVLSRRWRQRKLNEKFSLFIVDEMHLIGGSNGPVLEVITSRVRYITQDADKRFPIRIVGLSSPVANAKDLGDWIGATYQKTLFAFPPNARPVPLDVFVQGFDLAHFETRMLAMCRPVFNAIMQHAPNKPSIVFAPSKKHAQLLFASLIEGVSEDSSPFRAVPKDQIDPWLAKVFDPVLRQTLAYGIALIQEEMHPVDQQVVQDLFESGAIQVVIAPYTCAWGMTLIAHLVVLFGTSYFDGASHRYSDYAVTDILQMLGRANRPKQDAASSGKAVIMCHTPRKEYLKKFLIDPLPVESHLDHFLADHLNAEIVVRYVENKQNAVDYLTWTFLYRRLTQNPNYYNMQGTTRTYLSDYLSELVETTVQSLADSNCISVDEDDMDLAALNNGIIASYYYIRYNTIALFARSLTKNTKLRGLVELLAAASEFDTVPVRYRDDKLLPQIAKNMPLPISSTKYTDPHYKVNVLLQAYISRVELPAEFQSDLRSILETASRLVLAMVDVVSSNSWLLPAIAAMELSQMLVQAMWLRDSKLLQLPHFTPAMADICKSDDIAEVGDLLDMDENQRSSLFKKLQLSSAQIRDVASACNRYPNIELQHDLPTSLSANEAVQFKVELRREDEEAPGPVTATRFPRRREEGWWLVLGDEESNELFLIKRVPNLAASATLSLDFTPTQSGQRKYHLYFMCDSYVGCDLDFAIRVSVQDAMQE